MDERLIEQTLAWLTEEGLAQRLMPEVLDKLLSRFDELDLGVDRFRCGILMLHPLYRGFEYGWTRGDKLRRHLLTREDFTSHHFRRAPFFLLNITGRKFERYRLDDIDDDPLPLVAKLKSEGFHDYCAFFATFQREADLSFWSDRPADLRIFEGVAWSVSSQRACGFSDDAIGFLKRMSPVLGLLLAARANLDMASELLYAYLGHYSASRVLSGQTHRGDGDVIHAAVWFSDLRDSTHKAESMTLRDYLDHLNEYFELTAGVVEEHGGEVLKFIGDAVLAIFPIGPDADERAMCRKALDAARESIAQIDRANIDHTNEFEIGIGLHVGEVSYGNVGTSSRLDFTVIGPTVNEASRLEGLCKAASVSMVMSQDFVRLLNHERVRSLGRFELRGMECGLEVFTLDERRRESPTQTSQHTA